MSDNIPETSDIFDTLVERGKQLKTITGPKIETLHQQPKSYNDVTNEDRAYVGMLFSSSNAIHNLYKEGKGEEDPEVMRLMDSNKRAQEKLLRSGVFGGLRSQLITEHIASLNQTPRKVGGEAPINEVSE